MTPCKKIIIKVLFLICAFFFTSLTQAAPLTIAVASNLAYVFNELAVEFKKQTGIETQSVLGASGKIATQIRKGAPFDVFMSADMDFPDALYKEGFASTRAVPYAYGQLVLWAKKGVNLKKDVTFLRDKSIHKVAIANPQFSPFGKQALAVLDYYKMRATVEPKLVYGESITQISQYIDAKAVDVGFSAKSIVLSPQAAGEGQWFEVPAESYVPIAQGVVILKHGSQSNGDAARKFYQFVRSATARDIFAKNGYKLP